ncbi:ABC transporter substrate-binding protein [Methylobacterium sp. JK268]
MAAPSRCPNRRRVLAGLGACAIPPLPAAAAGPSRVASLDYGLAQTLIALGRPPVGLSAVGGWSTWVVEPPLPAGIVDLGTARETNFELLQQLKPDLIVSTPYLERLRPLLARVAPVESFAIHATDSPPWPHLVAATRRLGDLFGAADRAEAFLAEIDGALAASAPRVAPWRDRPVLLVSFQDARNVWVFGRNSFYDDVLRRLGLANGWAGRTNPWGFAAVGMEALARVRDARLICFDPVPPEALRLIADSAIWRATGFSAPGRLVRLPPVFAFGTLPSAARFARLLAEAAAHA